MLLEVVRADCVVSTDHPRQMEGGQKAQSNLCRRPCFGVKPLSKFRKCNALTMASATPGVKNSPETGVVSVT